MTEKDIETRDRLIRYLKERHQLLENVKMAQHNLRQIESEIADLLSMNPHLLYPEHMQETQGDT